jgi:hypothetical protein
VLLLNKLESERFGAVEQLYRAQKLELLKSFMSDERMKNVWDTLRQCVDERERFRGRSEYDFAGYLFQICCSAYFDWLGKPKETSAQKRVALRKISKEAAHLSKLIRDSRYFQDGSMQRFRFVHQ